MGELWGHCAKWDKPVTKGPVLHSPTYVRSPEPSNSCCCCLVAKLCLTLFDPMDCSPPGSSVHGISQERIMEWVAMPSSRGSSRPRDRTHISCVSYTVGGFFTTRPPGKQYNGGCQVLGEERESRCWWAQSCSWVRRKCWWQMVLTVAQLWMHVMTLPYILKKA